MDHKNLTNTHTFQRTQLLQVTLLSLAYFFDGQQTFISIFTDAVPTWHCAADDGGACTPTANICKLPVGSWAWDGGWSHQTFVSDWRLQCATSILRSLPASAFFLGSLLGGFFLAPLADSSLGRKNLMVLSCATMSAPAILISLVSNVWTYAALRFVSGFGRSSIGTCFLVLSSEIVSKEWRGRVGILGFFEFTLGFLSLPGIAYLNRAASWKYLYLITSIPAAVYCPILYWMAMESPRWLYTQGRTKEAVGTLKTIAPLLSDNDAVLSQMLSEAIISARSSKPRFYEVLERGWGVRRLLLVVPIAFGIGLVYYGMPLGVGNLGFSSYLAVTFNALSEIPSALLAFCFIGKWKRRSSLLGFTVASCVSSAICAALGVGWRGLRVVAELVSFLCACTASSVLLIYTLELFPTCVRNSATSAVRQMQVFGGAFGPLLAATGAGDGGRVLFYGVMGVVILICGMFVVFLPETKGTVLCDTMDEQETMERDRDCDQLF